MAGDDTTKEKEKGAVAAHPATAGTLVLDTNDAIAATQAAEAIASGSGSLVGATIAGRYTLIKKLGEGGMGTVYQALHTVLEKQVALKILHAELARKPHLVDRFLQEAKAASRIRHENVIDISDFGAADGHVFFAMELLHGHDLHEEITRARGEGKLLPWARTKTIFLQVCSALSVAHDRGIVHRDLKPENIYLVEFRGDPDFVKLLDFGIAKMTDVSTSDEGRKLTKTGMLFGTPEYMAPEQARGEKADHRVDVYAMGCILFLLVTNRLPFQADNFMGVLSMHLTDDPPEIAPETFDQIGAPREIADVIDRALAKDREERWQTMDELIGAICEACGDPLPADRSKPNKAASVIAPGQTTRIRTPTDQPAGRARTPSGSGSHRAKRGSESGEQRVTVPGRPRTPTGPQRERSRPPTSRSKPPTSPPRASSHDDWQGHVDPPGEIMTLGPVPEPESKHTAAMVIAGIMVVGIVAAAAYGLGWFGSKKAPATAATGSAAVTPAPTPAPTPTPGTNNEAAGNEALPDTSDIVFDSTPRGASVIALPANNEVGKTPYTLTVVGSRTPRQFKLVYPGYGDATVEVVPNKEKIEIKPQLVRGSTPVEVKPVPTPDTNTKKPGTTTNDTTTPVTKPDTSSAVTKPDSSATTTPDNSPHLESTPPPPPPPTDKPPEQPPPPKPEGEAGSATP